MDLRDLAYFEVIADLGHMAAPPTSSAAPSRR